MTVRRITLNVYKLHSIFRYKIVPCKGKNSKEHATHPGKKYYTPSQLKIFLNRNLNYIQKEKNFDTVI